MIHGIIKNYIPVSFIIQVPAIIFVINSSVLPCYHQQIHILESKMGLSLAIPMGLLLALFKLQANFIVLPCSLGNNNSILREVSNESGAEIGSSTASGIVGASKVAFCGSLVKCPLKNNQSYITI
jgi:hypothetical protein